EMTPLVRRMRKPSLLGSKPPVSTSEPSCMHFCTNWPMASMRAGGGPASRYDSGWRMKVRYFMTVLRQGNGHLSPNSRTPAAAIDVIVKIIPGTEGEVKALRRQVLGRPVPAEYPDQRAQPSPSMTTSVSRPLVVRVRYQ